MAKPTQYPVFEADQVLTNKHLNDAFDYLDAQNRITRTHLIGIGIVCGLELAYNKIDTVSISKGCGITSLGLLAFFEKSKNYTFARALGKLSKEFIDQNPLTNLYDGLQYWELLETASQASDTTLSPNFLDNKVIMLLVEADLLDLKNCDTTDCSDKGKRMEFRLRPLLITTEDAKKFARQKETSFFSLENRFALKDLHLHKFDVTATQLHTPQDVLMAFGKMMDDSTIKTIAETLSEAYQTFRPLLKEDFSSVFISLHTTLTQNRDALKNTVGCQYAFDWIDDLVKTYHEIQENGTECLTLCCPAENLFPYHLLLGRAIFSTTDLNQNPILVTERIFRTYFIHSPIANCHSAVVATLQLLFKRLVLMIEGFGLSHNNSNDNIFSIARTKISPIKITPSRLGNDSLSVRAIPYYYKPTPLYLFWDYQKTRKYKADTNLSYHSALYSSSPAVRMPLLWDTEAYNFFRIEGHIGLNYQTVLAELVRQRQQYRLPFNIVALKAKKFDEGDIDFTKIKKSLSDLEISYDIVRREWEAIVGQNIEWLDDNKTDANTAVGTNRLHTFIGKLVKAKKFMFDNLAQFIDHYHEFIPLYEAIEAEADTLATELREKVLNENRKINAPFTEDLIDHLDEIGLSIAKGPFRALHQDFKTRVIDILKHQYLEFYAQQHPSIEHKAGVARGGTFIIVYAESQKLRPRKRIAENTVDIITPTDTSNDADCNCFETSFNDRIKAISDISIQNTVLQLLGEAFFQPKPSITPAFADGVVFADFYLPYLCCGDGNGGITYILEAPKKATQPILTLEPTVFCNNNAAIQTPATLPEGGVLKIDGIAQNLVNFIPKNLSAGTHTLVYEANGQSSVPVDITIREARAEAMKISVSLNVIEPQQLVTFTIENPIAGESYRWDLGDGTTAMGNPVSHAYAITNNDRIQTFLVHVSSENSPCDRTESSTEITVQAPESSPIFAIEQQMYCWRDKTTYCFVATPAIKNISEIENPDGLIFTSQDTACFMPIKQKITTTTPFSLTYQGITRTITISKPDANFTIKMEVVQEQVKISLEALDTTLTSYEWSIIPFEAIIVPNQAKPFMMISVQEFLGTIEKNNGELTIRLMVGIDNDKDGKIDCSNGLSRKFSLEEVRIHLEQKDTF